MVETALIAPDGYLLSYENWLGFPEDNRFYEILGGELFGSLPPAPDHQRVACNLVFHLRRFLEAGQLGEVLFAPVGVKLSEADVVEPDLLVVLAENRSRIRTQVIEGPPDLVVEILSPGTAQRDLGLKRSLYERSGVKEYWIVDPRERRIEVLEGTRYPSGSPLRPSPWAKRRAPSRPPASRVSIPRRSSLARAWSSGRSRPS
jgi:Uma2 family endonuclease